MWFPNAWYRSLMLRRKLIAAFSAMALLTALSGAVAFYFVAHVGGAVFVFSDVTQPLARGSLELSNNAEHMAKLVIESLVENRDPEATAKALATLAGKGKAIVEDMRGLAVEGHLRADFEEVSRSHVAFVDTLSQILEDHRRGRAAAAQNAERQIEFRRQRLKIQEALSRSARRIDGLEAELEQEAKLQQQRGTATPDSLERGFSRLLTEIYPVQRQNSQLLGEVAAMADMARQASKLDAHTLAEARKETETRFGRIDRMIEEMGVRLRGQDAAAEFEAVKADLAGLAGTLAPVHQPGRRAGGARTNRRGPRPAPPDRSGLRRHP